MMNGQVLSFLILAGVVVTAYSMPGNLPTWIKKGSSNSNPPWAFLVATSHEWENYRHQADVCHAYQVLRGHGVPADNIIVMMYDDIAYNKQNPTPGVIINEPGGPNVYAGVRIDYSGSDVTPKNFLSVLRGDAEAVIGIGSGRVIEADANTNIFVYVVDHGAPGIIAFPRLIQMLTARELNSAILQRYNSHGYKEMAIYVETCFSGSMFERHLPRNISVYAVTSANSTQSSFACYFNETLYTYLGDTFSVNWIKNAENADTTKETLQQQYEQVKEITPKSQVSQFGQLNIAEETLNNYMGGVKNTKQYKSQQLTHQSPTDAVPSGDVRIAILSRRIFKTSDEWLKAEYEQKLIKELMAREEMRNTITRIVNHVTQDRNLIKSLLTIKRAPTKTACIKEVATRFAQKCFDHNYALKVMFPLVNLCDAFPQSSVILAVETTCK